MSMIYHGYDSNGDPIDELVAGAYAEHVGTLGFDEQLSTTSKNGVENRVITNKILQDEADYLLKAAASTTYVTKTDFATALNTYVTKTDFASELNTYVTKTDLASELNTYVAKADFASTLNTYVTKTDLTSALNTYVTKTDFASALNTYVAKSDFASALNTAIQTYYPVGTIYMNDRSSSVPFNFGTWSLIDGKFLYGCSSNFSDIRGTGGKAKVTLALANLPSDSISITIPSLTGTAASASTEHTHSGKTDANNRGHTHGVTVNGNTIGGMKAVQVADGLNLATVQFYGGTGTGYGHGHTASAGGESQDHTHTFTTGGMSKNSTHIHTVTTDASSTSVRLGSATAFSIIPPYHKCAIWHRTA